MNTCLKDNTSSANRYRTISGQMMAIVTRSSGPFRSTPLNWLPEEPRHLSVGEQVVTDTFGYTYGGYQLTGWAWHTLATSSADAPYSKASTASLISSPAVCG